MAIDFEIVNNLYQEYLDRQADPDGLEYHCGLDSVADIENSLVSSDEFLRNDHVVMKPNFFHSWKICVDTRAKIIFVPIAKCGHTSILAALLESVGINWRTLNISDPLVTANGNDDDLIHYALGENRTGLLLRDHPPLFIDKVLRSSDWVRVAVVRNPVERFLSTYNHFFVQWQSNPMGLRHTQAIRKALGLGDSSTSTSPGMVQVMKYLMTRADTDIDPHFAPQYRFISGLKIDVFIPLENIEVLEKLFLDRGVTGFHVGQRNVRLPVKGYAGTCPENVQKMIEEFYWLDQLLYEKALRG